MFSLYLMEQMGHDVPCLVNIVPQRDDSWVFHTPNLHLMPLMADALGKGLVQVRGGMTEEEDLTSLASALDGMGIDGVITGAIASDYQWDRINRVCEALGLKTLSPLWRKDAGMLMREMVDAGVRAMVVAVMADGLDESWLGRVIDQEALDELEVKSLRYGINVAGEGGEYETLTLDSPLHRLALEPLSSERKVNRDSAFLRVTSAHLTGRKDRMKSSNPA